MAIHQSCEYLSKKILERLEEQISQKNCPTRPNLKLKLDFILASPNLQDGPKNGINLGQNQPGRSGRPDQPNQPDGLT